MSNKYKKQDISKFRFQAAQKIQGIQGKNSNFSSQEIRRDRKNPRRYDI